jgi:hypothetical protein
LHEHDPAEHGRGDHTGAGDQFGTAMADRAAKEARDQEAGEREEEDGLIDHSVFLSPSSC